MPYERNVDLPAPVRDHPPEHAQAICREAFDSAFEEYKSAKDRRAGASREETAHKVAWSAVKQKYEKRGDRWQPKD